MFYTEGFPKVSERHSIEVVVSYNRIMSVLISSATAVCFVFFIFGNWMSHCFTSFRFHCAQHLLLADSNLNKASTDSTTKKYAFYWE